MCTRQIATSTMQRPLCMNSEREVPIPRGSAEVLQCVVLPCEPHLCLLRFDLCLRFSPRCCHCCPGVDYHHSAVLFLPALKNSRVFGPSKLTPVQQLACLHFSAVLF
eukprot:RCo049022